MLMKVLLCKMMRMEDGFRYTRVSQMNSIFKKLHCLLQIDLILHNLHFVQFKSSSAEWIFFYSILIYAALLSFSVDWTS